MVSVHGSGMCELQVNHVAQLRRIQTLRLNQSISLMPVGYSCRSLEYVGM